MSVSCSPVGGFIASGSEDKKIKVWFEKDRRFNKTLKGHRGKVCSVDSSPDGKTLVSSGRDGLAIVWDVDSGEIVKKLEVVEFFDRCQVLPLWYLSCHCIE